MKKITFDLDMLRSTEPEEEVFRKKLQSSKELRKIFAYFYEKCHNQGEKHITVRDIAHFLRKSEPQVRQWFYVLMDFKIIRESPTTIKGKTIGYFLNRNDEGHYKKYVKLVHKLLKND